MTTKIHQTQKYIRGTFVPPIYNKLKYSRGKMYPTTGVLRVPHIIYNIKEI